MALISPDGLRALVGSPDLRLADVRWYLGQPDRGREAYASGHIPGATFVDLDRDLSAPAGPGRHPLPDPGVFAARMFELGFGGRHSIVVYDDVSGGVAARLWWMLDALGHPGVTLLDGGLGAWVAAGGPVVTGEAGAFHEPASEPARLTLAEAWPRVIDREVLAGRLGEVDLVDVRAPERYRGEVEPVDPAAGHIPTARNVPTADLLGPDGHLLGADLLAARLSAAGVAGAERGAAERVLSCGSGVTACLGILAHRVAGLPDPLLYAGSFSDWSSSGMPVATGSARGTMPA